MKFVIVSNSNAVWLGLCNERHPLSTTDVAMIAEAIKQALAGPGSWEVELHPFRQIGLASEPNPV